MAEADTYIRVMEIVKSKAEAYVKANPEFNFLSHTFSVGHTSKEGNSYGALITVVYTE